jgi:uncharacterized protein (TIGR02284 family)
MVEDRDESLSRLNDLIETCKIGEEGYRLAADKVEDAELKSLFSRYAEQRAKFASELQGEVRKLGGEPEESAGPGGVSDLLMRGWLNIKLMVSGDDRKTILAECEEGEDMTLEKYQKAMEEGVPAEAQTLVREQYSQVKEAHDRIRDLDRAADSE